MLPAQCFLPRSRKSGRLEKAQKNPPKRVVLAKAAPDTAVTAAGLPQDD
jgi:hypothetical protein